MTKTLKDFFEVYRPKSPDEQKFVDKHVVIKHKDRNGNGDDVFNAKNIKKIDRKKENHGYEPGEDEKVYEEVEQDDEHDYYVGKFSYQHRSGHYVKARVSKHPAGGYQVHWADGSKSRKTAAEMAKTIQSAGLIPEEAGDLDEGQGSFTRNTPMGKKQKDTWNPASKKPRKDFDRDKRTVKDDDLDEMTGSSGRVSPMSKPARYDASGGRKPRSDFNRAKRTIKKADLEECLAALDEGVNFKHFTFTTGPKISGMGEGPVDHVQTKPGKATKLGVPNGAWVSGHYGETKTVTVKNNETGEETKHSVYQRDHVMGNPLMTVRSVGAPKAAHPAHAKALKAYLAGKRTIKEDIEQIDELSDELKTRYLVKTWPKRGETIPDKRKPFMAKAREAGDRHWAKQRADSEEAGKQAVLKRTPAVHDLRHMSHGQAYDHTQTSEKIKDGDVLHVKGGAAIMMKAWPTMVHGDSKSLHSWDAGHSWGDKENAHYGRAVKLAKSLKESTEQIDEVGDTKAGRAALARYVVNRTDDMVSNAYNTGRGKLDRGKDFNKTMEREVKHKAGIMNAAVRLAKPRTFRRYYGEELATTFIDKYVPELAEAVAVSSEDQLVTLLMDSGINESMAADILYLHNSIDENNQRHLLTTIISGGLDEVVDFAIQNRGE